MAKEVGSANNEQLLHELQSHRKDNEQQFQSMNAALQQSERKYMDQLRETSSRQEKHITQLMQDNRKQADSIKELAESMFQLYNSKSTTTDKQMQRAVSSMGQTSAEEQTRKLVTKTFQRLETNIKQRSGRDDVTRQMLVDRDLEIKKLRRQLEDSEGQLENYKVVIKATNDRLQEEQRPKTIKDQRRTTAADYKPSVEHLTRIRRLKTMPEPLFSASCVAAEMFQCGALTMKELEKIRTSRGDIEAAETLLDILQKTPREVFECFLQALRHTKQEHVYQQIIDQEFTADIEHCRLIRKHYLYLLDKLDTKHSLLTVHLYDSEVLSLREKEDIEAELTSTRQNEKLLSVLSRKSAEQWKLFLTALDNTGQWHIVNKLTGRTDTVPDPTSVGEKKVELEVKLKQEIEQKQLDFQKKLKTSEKETLAAVTKNINDVENLLKATEKVRQLDADVNEMREQLKVKTSQLQEQETKLQTELQQTNKLQRELDETRKQLAIAQSRGYIKTTGCEAANKSDGSDTGVGDMLFAPCEQNTWKSLVGCMDSITQREYYKITRIIPTPVLKQSMAMKEIFGNILPYIRQRVKMRGCHALHPGHITVLFDLATTVMHCNNPFKRFSGVQQAIKRVSCPISRLDFITCLLLTADDIVKADLLLSMSQCPMALPLVMKNCDNNTYTIMTSHLRWLKVNWETGSFESSKLIEHSLFRDKYRMLVAVRLGCNYTGKSAILNQLLVTEHMFSSIKEPGARNGKPMSLDGTVEMVWLTRETCKDNFWNVINSFYSDNKQSEICLLANLHGDATKFPETIRFLNELSCKYLVFVCKNCSPEKYSNLQQCAGQERIASVIRVDPNDYQPQYFCDIDTSQLIADETLEKMRQIIASALQSCDLSAYPEEFVDVRSGIITFPTEMTTDESCLLIEFVAKNSCKAVKRALRLQREGYSDKSVVTKRKIFETDVQLQHAVKLIITILNLPLDSLQRAMIHLERELSRLSDIESRSARDERFEIRSKLRVARMKSDTDAISKLTEALKSFLQQNDDCNLRVEHLFREISCVHEISLSDPSISTLHRNVAELFLCGHPVELVDCDASDIPESWLKSILGVINLKFPNLRVFVVSVIGLQSSGKSTLLNTLFACPFPVPVGRCSRGLFMRLLFLDKELAETHNFDAILLIDTEGLGAPEKMNEPEAEADRRNRLMATFAMSISNLTLINVLGENITQMMEILQIAILTLTRLEQTRTAPDIMMVQCLITGKNKQESAYGQDQFTTAVSHALHFVDKEGIHVGSRSSECLRALRQRVEDENTLFQLRCYKDGASANASPSQGYHEDAVELYKTILECGKSSDKTFEFNNWRSLVIEYWKAAKCEDSTSRFEHIKEVVEFIDREERIGQCKRCVDDAFYEHERMLKKSVEWKVHEVTIEDIRRDARKKFMRFIEAKLNAIPETCTECDKCRESCNKVQLLYDSMKDRCVKEETVKAIDKYITAIRETTITKLRLLFDAGIIQRRCSVDLDDKIYELVHYYKAKCNKDGYSEQETKTISATIFSELRKVAESMKSPKPITTMFINDLAKAYTAYPTMAATFTKASVRFEDMLPTSIPHGQDHSFRRFFVVPKSNTSMSQELLDLMSKLGSLPQELIARTKAECYDHRMIEKLKHQVDEEHKLFQSCNYKLCRNINVMLLHIWAQQLLCDCVKDLHKTWFKKTNPLSVLEANAAMYTDMIKTRLKTASLTSRSEPH